MILYSIILFFSIVLNNALEIENENDNTVYIGYKLSNDCRKYFRKQSEAKNITNFDTDILTKKHLRDLTLHSTIKTTLNKGLDTKKLVEKTVNHGFYETTEIPVYDEDITFKDISQDPTITNQKAKFKWLKFIGVDQVVLPDSINAEKFITKVKNIPCVDFAEMPTEHTIIRPGKPIPFFTNTTDSGKLPEILTPNDPYYNTYQWYLRTINMENTWKYWKGPNEQNPYSLNNQMGVVGVTDSGCDVNHSDMTGRYWKNPGEICNNGIDDDKNGYIDDCYGWNFYNRNSDLSEQIIHGTSVSSSITVSTNNSYGIAGVCWTCKIMCLKIGGEGLSIGALAEAINYAKGFHVKIINYSAGGGSSRLEESAIREARSADVLFVVASGNSDCNLDINQPCASGGYPVRYGLDNVLAVGASTKNNQRASFSDYGKRSVHVFAPGVNLLLLTKTTSRNSFAYSSGTSFSSPLTAGVAALVRSKYPWLTYKQVIRAFIESCTHNTNLTAFVLCGGIIDAEKVFLRAGQF